MSSCNSPTVDIFWISGAKMVALHHAIYQGLSLAVVHATEAVHS